MVSKYTLAKTKIRGFNITWPLKPGLIEEAANGFSQSIFFK